MGNKEEIDKYWPLIKESLVKNHTLTKYVEYSDTKNGAKKFIDTLFGRVSTFSNPSKQDPEVLNETLNAVYVAMVEDNAEDLAIILG